MRNSPVFPEIPHLGTVANVMIAIAGALTLLTLLGTVFAEISNLGMFKLIGAILALGGTGKFLLTARNNLGFFLVGIVGWAFLAI
jgi:hypothetical protein